MSGRPFTLALVQEAMSPDRDANIRLHVARIREARQQGADVVCLSELFATRYFCKSLHPERFDLAEPIPGPTTELMQRLAAELEVVLVVPLFERQAAGLYRNSAAVIDADGSLLGVYRKMHIPHDPLYEEKYYFAPGEADEPVPASDKVRGTSGFRVWRTRYADIGVLICWDQWFPEAARITALLGAEVLLYPTAIGWHPREKERWGVAQADAWRTVQRAHAIANGLYVAACNRVGFEPEPGTDGLEFFGHSFVADPFGRVVAEGGSEPSVVLARCDPALVEEARRNWPFLRDRRVDAYSGLSSRHLG